MQILIILIPVIIFLIILCVMLTGTADKWMERRLTRMGTIATKAQANIINNNEDILTETANKSADINKDAIRTLAHSVKEGFSENSSIYCKHCGRAIDSDSKFCKNCGKEQ